MQQLQYLVTTAAIDFATGLGDVALLITRKSGNRAISLFLSRYFQTHLSRLLKILEVRGANIVNQSYTLPCPIRQP